VLFDEGQREESAEPKAMPSADNSCHLWLTVSIDKLTNRLKLTEEERHNSFFTNVVVKISLSVVDVLNDHLVIGRIEHDGADVGRLEVVRLEEHVS
jgi:hypothetical protein